MPNLIRLREPISPFYLAVCVAYGEVELVYGAEANTDVLAAMASSVIETA